MGKKHVKRLKWHTKISPSRNNAQSKLLLDCSRWSLESLNFPVPPAGAFEATMWRNLLMHWVLLIHVPVSSCLTHSGHQWYWCHGPLLRMWQPKGEKWMLKASSGSIRCHAWTITKSFRVQLITRVWSYITEGMQTKACKDRSEYSKFDIQTCKDMTWHNTSFHVSQTKNTWTKSLKKN